MSKRSLVLRAAAAVAFTGIAGIATADYVTYGNGWGSKWDDPVHGKPAVITWGFVTDGAAMAPTFPLAPEVTGTSNVGALRSSIDAQYGAGAFDAALGRAFDTWERVAGVTFVGPVADSGLPVGSTGATSPDIRISAFTPAVGAGFNWVGAVGYGPPGNDWNTSYFDPWAGELIFNLGATIKIHPGPEGTFFNYWENDLEGLFLHELGHAAIGIGHPAAGPAEVMYVGIGCCQNINRIPSPDDIAGARAVYGPSSTPACQNGIDDDGDGGIDMADDGCNLVQLATEKPQCDDGIDNDADLAVDFPADTLCQGPWDDNEASNPGSCGLLGIEALLPLALWRRRKGR
jgi:hypothetical protein